MELFLETAAQRARRLAAGDDDAGTRSAFSGLWSGADTVASPCTAPMARVAGDSEGGDAFRAKRRHLLRHGKAKSLPAAEEYSIQQESYRKELAFDRARTRRRKMLAVLRVLIMIVAIPAGLALLFVASYSLTCILRGATPDEVLELLQMMFERICDFASRLG